MLALFRKHCSFKIFCNYMYLNLQKNVRLNENTNIFHVTQNKLTRAYAVGTSKRSLILHSHQR